jgi:hypothetical protein
MTNRKKTTTKLQSRRDNIRAKHNPCPGKEMISDVSYTYLVNNNPNCFSNNINKMGFKIARDGEAAQW